MKLISILAAAVMSFTSASSIAGPITPDAGWYGFCFSSGAGNPARSGCQNEAVGTTGNSFTFTLATAGVLKVTDAYLFGDNFDVYVNSVLAFTTGGGTYTGDTTSNPDLAYNSGAYDSGFLNLAAGMYSVDIFTKANVAAGAAYLEVVTSDAVVPEPGALSLLALGLVGLGAIRRKQG